MLVIDVLTVNRGPLIVESASSLNSSCANSAVASQRLLGRPLLLPVESSKAILLGDIYEEFDAHQRSQSLRVHRC